MASGSMGTGAEDWWTLQMAELEAIQAIYPDQVTVQQQQYCNKPPTDRPDGETASLPLMEVCVGTSPCLCVSLKERYPLRAGLSFRWKDGGGLAKNVKDDMIMRLETLSSGLEGGEHLLAVVQEFLDLAEALPSEPSSSSLPLGATPEEPKPLQQFLGRRLIFFHHIINANKRETVMKEAVALGLGGYSKIGWPGVVVVEGDEEGVQHYVRRLHGLRWQQMTVRGEERVEVPSGQSLEDSRVLHRGFEELGERDMSVLAQRLRDAGLESLLQTLLK